ncbi:hypothetical protein TrRE_jg6550 [Triparma retinervis]|uniref:Cyclic nucleotide-binding domain-containing protein n=1 Tax=Triparma retinervis TaxID=2557542 RepID=A0A9W7F445_9STRA|nr:hypothetical protein TrRE_jg6550 [Triparma retinervis]
MELQEVTTANPAALTPPVPPRIDTTPPVGRRKPSLLPSADVVSPHSLALQSKFSPPTPTRTITPRSLIGNRLWGSNETSAKDMLNTPEGSDHVFMLHPDSDFRRRLIRLFRLPRLFRYVRRFTEDFHVGYLRVLKLLFLLLLFSHWNACLLFLVATIEDKDKSWIALQQIEDHPVADQYSWALFMSISHMLCIGYGVYPPETVGEVWAIIVSMSIGASLFACIVGSITAVLLSLDSASANFQGYINEVNAYFKHRDIPPDLQLKVTHYLYKKWAKGKEGVEDVNGDEVELNGLKMYDEVKILEGLSPSLRAALNLSICSNMLEKSPVFNRSFFPVQLQRWLAGKLSFVIFLSSDVLISEGDVPCEMYLIRKGSVRLSSSGVSHGKAVEGGYVGEIPMLFPGTVTRQPLTATAVDGVVEGFRYGRGEFEETLKHFPDLRSVMEVVARQKVDRMGVGGEVVLDEGDGKIGERKEEERETQRERIKQLEELFKKGKGGEDGGTDKDGDKRL